MGIKGNTCLELLPFPFSTEQNYYPLASVTTVNVHVVVIGVTHKAMPDIQLAHLVRKDVGQERR